MNLTGCYPPGHSRIFEKPLRLPKTPLAVGGSGQVYKASSGDGQAFLVKLAIIKLTAKMLCYGIEHCCR
ncbi:hypothetical protein WAI453_005634 [Rhynchosporium graminicola]